MAAGQKKRWLNAASVVNDNLQEQYRGKKMKNVDRNVLNRRPHISLKWDYRHKKVVAKREQIGITWRDISPFIDSVPQSNTGLADVIPVPREIFGLENLTGVLSYEVWKTHLSESERNLLYQFLPRGTDVDQVVQALLRGENFHFGNPFLSWGASLCSGDLHPDDVLHWDHCLKTRKKAYYSGLQKYHFDIIDNLQRWKGRWARCDDLEKDLVEEMWRCSSPQVVDKKIYVRKDKSFVEKNGGECQGRKHKLRSPSVASEVTKVVSNSKKELLHKPYICFGDAAQYMSYVKVKRIKQCRDGIQSKSLNHLLGDVKSIHVQTYKEFEEGERKKLHEHWLQLARRDLPIAFANCNERKLQKQLWMKCLEKEIAEAKKPLMDNDEEENLEPLFQEQGNNMATENLLSIDDVQNCKDGFIPAHSNQELQLMALDSEGCNRVILRQDKVPALLQLEDTNVIDEVIESMVPLTAAKDVRGRVSMSDSYCHPTAMRHGYTPADELSLRQPKPFQERQTSFIYLESDALEQEAGESLFHISSNGAEPVLHIDNGAPTFHSYMIQDHSGLLPSFIKGRRKSQLNPQEHINGLKPPGLPFLMKNNHPPENGQFHQKFQEQQQHLFEQRQIRERELYVPQVMQNIYSNSRYRRQELFLEVGVQGCATDSARAAPLQSLNSGLLGHDWLSNSRGHCLGYDSNTDESLSSILPNEIGCSPPYGSVNSEQYIHAGNFVGGSTSDNGDNFMHSPHQLNYLNACETAAAALQVENMSM